MLLQLIIYFYCNLHQDYTISCGFKKKNNNILFYYINNYKKLTGFKSVAFLTIS